MKGLREKLWFTGGDKERVLGNWLFVGTVLLFIFYALSFQSSLYWGSDTVAYVSQAECLLTGTTAMCEEYGNLHTSYPGRVGPNLYPWGYPTLIAPIIATAGADFYVLRLFNLVLFAAALFVIYHLFKSWLGRLYGAGLVFLVAASYQYYYVQNHFVLSELASLLVVFMTLLVLQHTFFSNKSVTDTYWHRVLVGVLVWFAVMVRTSNIVLLPTVWLVQIAVRRWGLVRPEVLLRESISTVTFAVLATVSGAVLPTGSYSNHFQFGLLEYVQTLLTESILFLSTYAIDIGQVMVIESQWLFYGTGLYSGVTAAVYTTFAIAVPVFLWFMAYVGARHSLRFEHFGIAAFLVFSLGLLFLYPYYVGSRVILQLAPIVLFFVLLGVKHYQEHSEGQPRRYRWILFGLVGCVLVSLLSTVTYRVSSQNYVNDLVDSESSQEVIAFVTERYGNTDLVHCFAPRQLEYETGVPAVRVYDDIEVRVFQEFPEIMAYVESKKFNDVPAVRQWLEERGTLVFENEVYMVYEANHWHELKQQ